MYMAYEEIAKAVFCTFAHKKWVTKEFIDPIFRIHDFKVFLFEEILRSFKVVNGIGYLGGEKLGSITLRDFQKIHEKNINVHRKKTLSLLYVDKSDSDWNFPQSKIPDIDKEVKQIKKKIEGLVLIYSFFINKIELPQGIPQENLDEFNVIETEDGTFALDFRIKT